MARRKVEVVSEAQEENALRPVWQVIFYLARKRNEGTITLQFRDIATTSLHSSTSSKSAYVNRTTYTRAWISGYGCIKAEVLASLREKRVGPCRMERERKNIHE